MFKKLLPIFIIAFLSSTIIMCVHNEFIIQESDKFSVGDIIGSTFFSDLILIVISLPGLALSNAKWCNNSLLKFIFYFLGPIIYCIFASFQINEAFGFFFATIGITFILPYAYFYNKLTTDNSSAAI